MKYRVLGKTGIPVSALSFGGSAFGGYFGAMTEEDARECVRTAMDLGINYFDTSPYYGETRAERILGDGLKGFSRQQYYLATKVGRYGPDRFDFSAKGIEKSVEDSLKRLRVDYVDLIQCHDIEFVSLDQVVEEAIPALRKMIAQGKARYLGITGLPLKIYRAVMDRVEVDAVLSYCHCCLNDTGLLDLLPYFQKKNVGIINAAPLAMGLLTTEGPPSWHPARQEIKNRCREAADFVCQNGENLAKIALQFSVGQNDVHTTLVGTIRPASIRENVRWLDEPVDRGLLNKVCEILDPIRNLRWPSGRPENND